MRYETIVDRLAANSVVGEEITYAGQPCWLWAGTCSKDGYGLVSYRLKSGPSKGKVRSHRVHRLAHKLLNNARVGREYVVRHQCNVRSCWNPAHLAGGSSKSNTADMLKAARHWSGFKGPKPGVREPELQLRVLQRTRQRFIECEQQLRQRVVGLVSQEQLNEDIPL